MPKERGKIIIIRASTPPLKVNKVRFSFNQHHIACLKITIKEGVLMLAGEVFSHQPEIGLKFQFVKIYFGSLEKAILEVIEVEENGIHIKLGLGITL